MQVPGNLSWYGPQALDRYKLYHQDSTNCFLHGLFLPFACAGVFVFLHGLLGNRRGHEVSKNIVVILCSYYMFLHPFGAFCTSIYYAFVIIPFSTLVVSRTVTRRLIMVKGIVLCLFCMVFLEFVAHTRYETVQSNLYEFHVSLLNGHLFSIMSLFGIKF